MVVDSVGAFIGSMVGALTGVLVGNLVLLDALVGRLVTGALVGHVVADPSRSTHVSRGTIDEGYQWSPIRHFLARCNSADLDQ
jgi:hypothetical protein